MFAHRVTISTKRWTHVKLLSCITFGAGLLLASCSTDAVHHNGASVFTPDSTGDRLKSPKTDKPVLILLYPKSKHSDWFYQNILLEIKRTEEQVKQFINEAKTAKSRGNWSNYLEDIHNGDAFLVPFTITNWLFVIPSRVFKEPGNQFVVIGRYLPEDSDVVVVAELDPSLNAGEVREAFKRLLSSSAFDKEALIEKATFRTTALFDAAGELNDPFLRELFDGQVFLQQH